MIKYILRVVNLSFTQWLKLANLSSKKHTTFPLSTMSQIKAKAVLIDLSGTLHIENEPTDGALEALRQLRSEKDLRIRFVTNTTKESKRLLLSRLSSIGFDIKENEIFSSLSAARQLALQRSLRPYLIMDKRALEDFEGIPQESPNAVMIGLAPDEFHYDNMNRAMRLVQMGADFIAINKARYYKTPDGLSLGAGAFVSALEYATDREAEIVGKPSKQFFLSSVSDLHCDPSECVMIGDDVRDDVGGAQATGMKGILVKSGKYVTGDEEKISPPPFKVVNTFADAVQEILKSV